jgi:transcriptional regulator with XRE-family HTH domain
MAIDPQSERATFGATIQKLRRERNLTQRDVAAKLGIDFTYLSKLENDRGEPASEDLVRKLAEILDADAEDLLALAGRVPTELREMAQQDVTFARLLRQLPNASESDLKDIYKRLKIKPPGTT